MAEEKETVVEENNETKTENTSSNNGGKKYHLIKENFNKALTYAIIVAAIITLHAILEACRVSGNLPWLIINIACTAGLVVFGIITLVFFLKTANVKRNEDLTTFIISLVAFIVAFVFALYYCIDGTRNLVGLFHEIFNK